MSKITRQQINDYSWQTMSLQNGWVVYDNDAPYGSARYRRDELGNIYMNLMVKNGTTTNGTVITNLPVGYRPPVQTIFNATNSSATVCRVDVMANGDVVANGNATAAYLACNVMFKAT